MTSGRRPDLPLASASGNTTARQYECTLVGVLDYPVERYVPVISARLSRRSYARIYISERKTRTAYQRHSFDMNAGACVSLTMQS